MTHKKYSGLASPSLATKRAGAVFPQNLFPTINVNLPSRTPVKSLRRVSLKCHYHPRELTPESKTAHWTLPREEVGQ